MENQEQKIKVSILTPAYNAADYIAETIESVLAQSYKDFEYIVCDDCSTDNTLNIIRKYASRDPRIAVIRNEVNLGIARTRNRLLEHASGQYIVWQEADDISVSDRIEKQLAFMDSHPEVGICGGTLECFDEEGVISYRRYPTGHAALRKIVFRYAPVPQPAAIIRRSCFDTLGHYLHDFTPADDLEMTLRIGARFAMANLPDTVLRFRIHNNTTSTTFSKLKKLELQTIRARRTYDGKGYSMDLFDKAYNILHYASIFLLPPRLKIGLFNWWRNTRA